MIFFLILEYMCHKYAWYSNLIVCVLVFCVFIFVLFGSILCLVYPMSLDCPFFIAPSVFSNVYLISVQQSLFIACTCFILGCYDQRSLGVSWYSIQAQNNSAAACQTICNSTDYFALQVINYLRCKYFRERPFNLKEGWGYGFF
jgi:hypothetical protein